MVKTIAALLCTIAMAASAEPPRDPAKYARVLLPFSTAVPGSNGAWFVSWWIRNDADVAADVFPLAFGCGLCPPDYGLPYLPNPSAQPHRTISTFAGDALPSFQFPAFMPVQSDRPGALLYVESAHLPQITITGSVEWRQYPAHGNAAALMAIPESLMLNGTGNIDAVPHIDGTRYALRIYALPESVGDGRVTVNVYEMQQIGFAPPELLLRTVDLALVVPNATLPRCAPPYDLTPRPSG